MVFINPQRTMMGSSAILLFTVAALLLALAELGQSAPAHDQLDSEAMVEQFYPPRREPKQDNKLTRSGFDAVDVIYSPQQNPRQLIVNKEYYPKQQARYEQQFAVDEAVAQRLIPFLFPASRPRPRDREEYTRPFPVEIQDEDNGPC